MLKVIVEMFNLLRDIHGRMVEDFRDWCGFEVCRDGVILSKSEIANESEEPLLFAISHP